MKDDHAPLQSTVKSRRTTDWKTQAVSSAVLFLLAIQFWFGILMAIPPQPGVPSTAPANPPADFLFLNHTQIITDEDGYWLVRANASIYLIAEVGGPDVPWGGDLAMFFWGEAGCPSFNQHLYTCDTGLHSWAITLGDDVKLYNLSIPATCRLRFTSLSVQPLYIAQGEVNATPTTPARVCFNASGDICVLAWSLSNFTDLALQLDSAALKRNDYSERVDYPCAMVAEAEFQSTWLRFPARVDAGPHVLDIWNGVNQTTYYTICHGTADADGDLLLDYEELMSGTPTLSPGIANAWGYHVSGDNPTSASMEDLTTGNLGGSWFHESVVFYLPDALSREDQSLAILAMNGQFTNLTIDGNQSPLANLTLQAYTGESNTPVTVFGPHGENWGQHLASDIFAPQWAYGGILEAGTWHTVSYEMYYDALEDPSLILFLNGIQVEILGHQGTGEGDLDNDTIPDSSDYSQAASLVWCKDSLLQFTVPCDRTAGEDVQVKFQVVRGANDPDPQKLLEWHATEEAGRQVKLTQVMILYGPGSNAPARGQVDYWNNLDDLCHFLNTTHPWPVDTYNLIGRDANGFTNTSALTGDCDALPQSGTAAYDYQMILFPSLAERVAEYTLWYPSDHPAIQNDGMIVIRARFAIAAIDQSKVDPNDYQLLGLYDYPSNIAISGTQVSFLSDINGLLGEPRDSSTHLAAWCYNMNPGIQMDWDPEIERAIVTSFTGAHLMTQYNYNPRDNTTLGAIERLNYARNQTPWDGQSAEVTYITQTTRTLDLLSKINQSILFDLTTGEQYCRYPNMYDFSQIAPGRYLNPGFSLVPEWTCTAGLGQVNFLRNVQTRGSVLELRSDTNDFTLQADHGLANDTGHLTFSLYLESEASHCEVRLGQGSDPDAFALVAGGGYLKYRDTGGDLQTICELWPEQWFDCDVYFDKSIGTWDVLVDGPMKCAAVNLSSWHLWNAVQTVDFTVSGDKTCLDGIGLYWSLPDPSEAEMGESYEVVHFGDTRERTSFYTISDVYNGTYAPGDPELMGGEITLWTSEYKVKQDAMERVQVLNWPVNVRLVRVGDYRFDGYTMENFLNISFAQGSFFPITWAPGAKGGPYTWAGRDVPDTVIFRHLLLNEWTEPAIEEVPATVCLQLGDHARWEWDWRVGEIDPWAPLCARQSAPEINIDVNDERADLIWPLWKIKQFFERLRTKIANKELEPFEVKKYHQFWAEDHVIIGKNSMRPEPASNLINPFPEPTDTMCWAEETINLKTLDSWAKINIEATETLVVILDAEIGERKEIPRYIEFNLDYYYALRNEYPEVFGNPQYFQENVPQERIPSNVVKDVANSILNKDKESPGWAKNRITIHESGLVPPDSGDLRQVGTDGKIRDFYAVPIETEITPAMKTEAIFAAGTISDNIHDRIIAGGPSQGVFTKYLPKFLGIKTKDAPWPSIGKPGQIIPVAGQEVLLPGIEGVHPSKWYPVMMFDSSQQPPNQWQMRPLYTQGAERDGYISIDLKKIQAYKDLPDKIVLGGHEIQIKYNMVFYLRGPRANGKWQSFISYTNFDPNMHATNLVPFPEDYGGMMLYSTDRADDVFKDAIREVGQKDPEYQALRDELKGLKAELGDPLPKAASLEDFVHTNNKVTKLYQAYQRDPNPPTKIKDLIHTREAVKPEERESLGQTTLIPFAGLFPARYVTEPALAEFLYDLDHAPEVDWKEAFQTADYILLKYLRLHKILEDSNDPNKQAKQAQLTKWAIDDLEEELPRGVIRNTYVQFKHQKLFPKPEESQKQPKDIPTLLKNILRRGAALGHISPATYEALKKSLQQTDWGSLTNKEATPSQESTNHLNPLKRPPTTEVRGHRSPRTIRVDYTEQIRQMIQNVRETAWRLAHPGQLPPWEEELLEEERARALAAFDPVPTLLGLRTYIARVGAALTFDLFIWTFLGPAAGIAPGTPLEAIVSIIGQSPVPQTTTVPIQVSSGNQLLLMAAGGGGSPPPVVSYTPEGYANSPTYPITTPEGYAVMPVYPNKSPFGGAYSPMPSSRGSALSFGTNAQNRYKWDPEGVEIVDAAQAELAPVKSEMTKEIDAMELSTTPAAPNIVAMQRMITIMKVTVVLSIVCYVTQTIQIIDDYEHAAPMAKIVLDWVSLGITGFQVGIAIETLALLSENYAITVGTMAISDALLTTGTVAEFLSAASAVTLVAAVILMAVSTLIYSIQEREVRWAETLNTVNPSVETRINFPTSTNASIVRDMCLHPEDEIGIQMTVGNKGYMTWDRYVNVYDHQPGVLYEALETEPRTSTGAPFWFSSRVRVGSPGALGDDTWTSWGGPSAGDPVDWDTWGSDVQTFDSGDLLYPEMLWRQQVSGVGAPWDVTTARSANVTYTQYATIPASTASLVVQLETRFDTTYNGRTNGTSVPTDEIIIGDTNGDGHLDPLYGEAGLPVLETSLDDFLGACQDATPPAITLDDIWSNFTTSIQGYQWRDATNYLAQLLAQAQATTIIPENQFNATVVRFMELTGAFAYQNWRTLGTSDFQTDPVPDSVVGNYYLLQTSGITEWCNLLGSDQGLSLQDAGWRAARPLYAPAGGLLYSQDFSRTGDFPQDWVRSCSGSTRVDWRDPNLKDQRVICIEENYSVNSQRIYKDFGTPLLGGRLCVTLEYAALTKEIRFGWESSQSYFPDGTPTPVGMFRLVPVAGGARIYSYSSTTPLFDFVLPPFAAMTFIIDLDVAAGTVTLACPVGNVTCPVFLKIPATRFSVDIGTLLWPVDDDFKLFISYLSLSNRDNRDAQLNGYGLTSPAGQILVPKTWNVTTRQAFNTIKSYSFLQSLLPCKTNINATYSWGTDAPVLEAGGTFSGTIGFIYGGADDPTISFEFIPPTGWSIGYDSRHVPLKNLLQVPFTLEVPSGTPAGTYYLDFVERRADGSSLSGNVTFACRIPIRVRYNATWALDIAGLGDVLDPGSINRWATLYNGGTAPQSLYITGDGVPLDWMTVDGHAPIARWDFNGGTGGWSYTGTSSATFEADRVDLTSMESVNNAYPGYNAQTLDFRASQYYDDARGAWIHDRTYFTVPAAMPTYVNPRSATLHEYLVGASVSVPSALLVISPASQSFTPGTMTWNTQPGYAPDQHAVERLASTLPASGWVSFPGLSFGTTYAVWMQESCTAQVDGYGTSGGSRAYVLHAYDKVTSDGANLVLQSNTNEVISATKNVSALICPGDRVRITYENWGATCASLAAWTSVPLTGSGRQTCEFIADGFYTLADLTVSARVGPGVAFRVDSISVERALARNAPLVEFTFAGETATPEMYGWTASFGSGTSTLGIIAPVSNAGYVDRSFPTSTFNTAELWVGNDPYGDPYRWASFLEIPSPPATMASYSTFGAVSHPLLVAYQASPIGVQASPCGIFYESNLTWANHPDVQQDQGINGTAWAGQAGGQFWAWDVTSLTSNYICLNTTTPAWWIFPSDEGPADIAPRAVYTIPKWGVTGGALVVQSDQVETFRVSRALAGGQNLAVSTGDKVWASFETTSAGGATITLVNANPLGANLSFPLATAADENRGTIYREFTIPAGGNYTAIILDGTLGAAQNFSLAFAGVYRNQPYGTPLASASIGGFYNETIAPGNFTQYAPITGGSFTFDGTTHGFSGPDVLTANGSLVLAPLVASAVTATCALAGMTVPANTRVRARYNSTASAGSYIMFRTDTGEEFTWMLPVTIPDSWQEATFALPQGNFTQIVIGGSFTPATNLSLDYLQLEVPVAAACVFPEVAGRRDVISLKNIPACGSVVDYSFPEPQSQGRLDFSFYAPGTNATLTITLVGAGGTCIQLAVADWQLWLGNLSGSFAAANIYSGWHDLSIAWDCASHNFTVWYFNQTLVAANYTTGWGVLNFPENAITGIRIGTADARAAYYLDGVYFDPVATSPTNQSLVESFQPGGGMYVDLRPGEEWSLQLVAPPRSPLTAPGTYPVHLAIYDASTGQLIGLIHKNITIPAFYDIGLACTAPAQIHQVDPYGTEDGNFDFTGTLANLGNVPQTFTLSAPGLDPRAPGTFYLDADGMWEIAGPITLAPGEEVSYKLEIRGAPTIICPFTIQVQSGNNMTSIPGSYVYNDMPVIEGGQIQDTTFVEWQPAGRDLLFTAWDDTTLDPWYEAWWNAQYLGTGRWTSGQAFNVSLDPLLAAGANILGAPQAIHIAVHDGYSLEPNILRYTVVVNDILPATITPPDIVTTWEGTFDALTWDVVDNGAWDPATGWQDDFGDGTLGPQWLPTNVTEANGTLRLPPPAQNPMGTQLLAPAPPGGDFAVVTRIAYAPYPADLYGGPGIVIPTDDQFDYIKWQAHPVNALRTSWTLVETRSGAGGTTLYRPITGNLTTLAVVVHGTGPSATYDLWYCLDDATWTRVVAGHTAFSFGAPAQRRFGLCTGPYDVAAQFDWVRCQTLCPAPGATYTVYKNGTPLMSGGWAGFGTVTVSLDDLRALGPGMIGNNNFTLVLTDPVGGRVSSMAWVNITQVVPVLSRPPNLSYTTGETPTITWDVSDNYSVTTHAYDLYLGTLGAAGTLVESGTWVSGGTIAYTLPTLAPGTYTCRVVTTNDLGGVSSDTVILTVVQPTIVPPPSVTSIEVPAGANQTVTWVTPSVSLAIECTTTDAVTMVASAWDDNPASGTAPGFVTGGAYFAIEASNPSAVQFPLTLTVTLPYNPTLWNYQDQIAQWMGIYIFDENTGTWVLAGATVLQVVPWGPIVKVGGEWIMVSDWLNITLSIPHLSTYAVGIINLPPAISSPADVAYLGGSTGHAITWQVTDDTTSSPTYTITQDGLLVGSGAWPGNNLISIPVDGLAPGVFNYTLVVDDGRHATASDSVLVVVDNFAPVLSAPVDIVYTWGTTGHAIAWQVTDDSFQDPTYVISRDGTVIASGAWPASNVISWNVDGLAVGTYWYRVDVFDGLTGTASDEVRVTVLNTLPVLSTPPDSSHEYGAPAPSIAWTVVDETVLAGTYTITLGGFPVAYGTWASGDTIAWAPGDLLPGTWTATLTVADGYGGTVSDAAAVTVTNAPPVISGPHSAIFEAGNASAGVWVSITDPSAASDAAYGIFRNGTRVASGRWASGGSIYVDLRFTPPGRNDIQVVAWDGLGGVATHAILATTTNMAPVVIAPTPVTFEVGTAAPVLQWTITDESAENATYAIVVNGTAVTNSTWASGDVVSFPLGDFLPASYNVTLVAVDGWGAVTTNGTIVVVTDVAPVIIALHTINYEAGDPRPVASFMVTDLSTRIPTYAAFLNGSLVATGTWASGVPVAVPISGLAPGSYFLTLVADDGYGVTGENGTAITVRPDDDTTCDIANLTCSATPTRVTFSCDLIDPSGYASLDWVALNGTFIPLANLSISLNGTRAMLSFNYTFVASGTYVLQFQLTDGDNDWPGDGAVGVFSCTFQILLADAVETLLGMVLGQLDAFIATARGISDRCWRNRILACAQAVRDDVAAALAFYQRGRASKTLARTRAARALAGVADLLVQVGQKVTHSHDSMWAALRAQAGVIQANLTCAIQLLVAAQSHGHPGHGWCEFHR